VVGHTELSDGPKIISKNKLKFVFTDTKKHDYLTIVDTETNEIKFGNLNIS